MSLADPVRPNPARNPAEGRERFERLCARDGTAISEAGRSRLLVPHTQVRMAVVLLHGFTNCPEQWMTFAPTLVADRCAVVIPRLPGHGFADRSSRTIGRVTASELLSTASEAVDIATGFAERVVVAGLSIGGSIAIWLGLHRSDVTTVVSIVPFFGIKGLSARANALSAWTLRRLPDFFIPWDPSGKNASIPPYGYTHFPTRVLGECLGVGIGCYDEARKTAPHGNAHFLLNAREPAISNELALEIAHRFEIDREKSTRTRILADLPANHDIVDPTNPEQRVAVVYPQLRELVES